MSVNVTLIIVVILLFVISSGCSGGETKDTKIQIVQPDKKVDKQEEIAGTAHNIPDNSKLWILVYSKDTGRFYPISEADINKYSEWNIPVKIGSSGDYGKDFDIVAIIADQNAQDRFNDSINETKDNKEGIYSKGILNITDGAKEYARITVKRDGFSFF